MKVECFYFLNTQFINKCLTFWPTMTSKVITIMEGTVLSVVHYLIRINFNEMMWILSKASVNQLSG